MNRITAAIEKFNTVSSEHSETFDMDINEFVRFQELKSLAVMDGRLTLEEGNTIYRYLGATHESFNKQPVSVKVVLTLVFKELMER